MHRSKRKRYILYPLLSIFLLVALDMRAQSSTDPAPAPAPAQTEPAPAATAPEPAPAQTEPAPAATAPAQAPAQTAPVPAGASGPQSAAGRVRARRQQRIQALIKDIYGHQYEAFAGYGYQRFRPGNTLQRVTEAAWNAGLTDYIRPRLGITVDTRGYYGAAYTYNNQFQVFQPSISQYVFLAGPQCRIMQRQHLAASIRVMGGVSHGNFDTGTGGLPGRLIGLYPNGNSLALNGGIPVDYNFSPALAVRVSPDVLYTRFGSANQLNLGFTTGIVYRFRKN